MTPEEMRAAAQKQRESLKNYEHRVHVCMAAGCLSSKSDAVKDAINKAFAGTGVQISAALAYEAQEIKKSLEDPRLPALVGVANREQLLKKLGVAEVFTPGAPTDAIVEFIRGAAAERSPA